MNCIYPHIVYNRLKNSHMLVRCRQCTPCRNARTQWLSTLCNAEYQSNLRRGLSSSMVTLTYHDDCRPVFGLSKREYKLFLKRLRKQTDKFFPGVKYKYVGCGEYGDDTYRPHYHFIFFGLPQSAELRKCLSTAWPYGMIDVGPLLPGGIRYVCNYVAGGYNSSVKKDVQQTYQDLGIGAPFCSHSLGIGSDWLSHCASNATSKCHYKSRGRELAFPTYYSRKYGLTIDTTDMEEYNYVESCLKNLASQQMATAHGIVHERVVVGSDPSEFILEAPFKAQVFSLGVRK